MPSRSAQSLACVFSAVVSFGFLNGHTYSFYVQSRIIPATAAAILTSNEIVKFGYGCREAIRLLRRRASTTVAIDGLFDLGGIIPHEEVLTVRCKERGVVRVIQGLARLCHYFLEEDAITVCRDIDRGIHGLKELEGQSQEAMLKGVLDDESISHLFAKCANWSLRAGLVAVHSSVVFPNRVRTESDYVKAVQNHFSILS